MRAELAEAQRRLEYAEAHTRHLANQGMSSLATELEERERARVNVVETNARAHLDAAERRRIILLEEYEQERAEEKQRLVSEMLQMQAQMQAQMRAQQLEADEAAERARNVVLTLYEQLKARPATPKVPPATPPRPVVPKLDLNFGPSEKEKAKKEKKSKIHLTYIQCYRGCWDTSFLK